MTASIVVGPAAIAAGQGGFVIDDIAVEPPGPGEVRVRIAAAGLCHTDYASLHWPGPLVMGHEGAGHVEAIGGGVEGLAVGQPVLLNWAIPCGACPQCRRGDAAICDRTLETDPARPGTSRAHHGATRWRGAAIARAFHLGTFARFTRSSILYQQMRGRGTRKARNKPNCMKPPLEPRTPDIGYSRVHVVPPGFTYDRDYRQPILTISASVPVTTKAILIRQLYFRSAARFCVA